MARAERAESLGQVTEDEIRALLAATTANLRRTVDGANREDLTDDERWESVAQAVSGLGGVLVAQAKAIDGLIAWVRELL